MAALDELIDEYLGTALTPAELRDLAALQVQNASVQDDAVARAVANAQGVEQRNRSALEEYLVAQEEQARQEAQKALEMAQQRLNGINQNIALLSSTVGLGKEGKRQLANLEKEKQDIFRAFPTLGEGGEGVAPTDADVFDVGKMLSAKDYSPEAVARMFEEGTTEDWDAAVRTGDLDLYQAMLDGKLGALPEGIAEKMRFVIAGKPETSKALKLDDKYARLRGVIGETQGDLKKKAADEKKAAAKAAADKEEKQKIDDYTAEVGRALLANNSVTKAKYQTKEFKDKVRYLKKKNLLKPEDEKKLRYIGDI